MPLSQTMTFRPRLSIAVVRAWYGPLRWEQITANEMYSVWRAHLGAFVLEKSTTRFHSSGNQSLGRSKLISITTVRACVLATGQKITAQRWYYTHANVAIKLFQCRQQKTYRTAIVSTSFIYLSNIFVRRTGVRCGGRRAFWKYW